MHMKKNSFIDVLRYKFDNLMSKGAIALVGMLFLATVIVVVVSGIIMSLMGVGTMGNSIWSSIMHVIDAGTIAGDDTTDVSFLALMSFVTLCGIFITSILIGIITTGFEEKLHSLKKGNARVIEKNHTLILGFNDNIYTILSELIEANQNAKNPSIVILADEDKETMDFEISKQILELRGTRIICRTGNISDVHMLRQCSIETCKSVIVNVQDDFMVTKAILAINNYFNSIENAVSRPHVVATVNDETNYEAIKIAGEGHAELVLISDSISRIIAQTCRQPGLSNVLIELFDYSGNELYFECFPELAGKKFSEVLNMFECAAVFGYKSGEEIFLNPDNDVVLSADDSLILLVEDDGMAKPLEASPDLGDITQYLSNVKELPIPENILILGTNAMLEQILVELDNYFEKGSVIVIADNEIDDIYKNFQGELNNIELRTIECDINQRKNLDELLKYDIKHILLLSKDDEDIEVSDAVTLLKLIHLRDIAQKQNRVFNITSEMKSTVNEKLANVAKVNDLVIGSNIINLILTQISENRDLATVFRELLQADGSELYLRKASDYVKLDTEMDFYIVTEVLSRYNELAIGYKKQIGDSFEIVTSPKKSDKITFGKDDYIVLLAED